MNTKSQHLLLDIWLRDDLHPYVDKINQIVDDKFTVVQKNSHKFEPQGETIVYILSESHYTLHTYPEHNYITLDIYICNMDHRMDLVRDEIIKICNPITYNAQIINRG